MLEITPENFEKSAQLITKGAMQMYEGDFISAISTFDKSLELNPISIFAYQYKSLCKTHLCVQNGVSTEEQRNYLQDIISDLEKSMQAARNHLRFLDSSSK